MQIIILVSYVNSTHRYCFAFRNSPLHISARTQIAENISSKYINILLAWKHFIIVVLCVWFANLLVHTIDYFWLERSTMLWVCVCRSLFSLSIIFSVVYSHPKWTYAFHIKIYAAWMQTISKQKCMCRFS